MLSLLFQSLPTTRWSWPQTLGRRCGRWWGRTTRASPCPSCVRLREVSLLNRLYEGMCAWTKGWICYCVLWLCEKMDGWIEKEVNVLYCWVRSTYLTSWFQEHSSKGYASLYIVRRNQKTIVLWIWYSMYDNKSNWFTHTVLQKNSIPFSCTVV